ncbi:beta-ketoacyl synthase N-terminal-like domain-containing protein [Paenibacillus hexagrammi]|uniref:Phosphopantetheine-binding protein n=1 Tax=Paenibacillus hexagrammi TaxID=2908839 RepID=A0ABY3SM09_9BACL|nr:beta-ketoacyl synthase N-terminal-like domain-containing protein [Paenibacillus sp. YPD9-1]UJF34759.1 phosphopantetheine-binding protein [Paenibacillus sp. YPD9-1]
MQLDSQEEIELSLITIITDLFQISRDSLDMEKSFIELGMNSVLSVDFIEAINHKLEIDLGVEIVFDYRGVRELADYIRAKYGNMQDQDVPSGKKNQPVNRKQKVKSERKKAEDPSKAEELVQAEDSLKAKEPIKEENEARFSDEVKRDSDIAIIGVSGRFAGSENVEQFWEHLQNGDCCVTEIDRRGWDLEDYYDRNAARKNKSTSKWGGLLTDIDKFDTEFFNITPREAERMDPQQRLFLEECFKAIEDSGYSIEQMAGRKAGVFVGGRSSDYKEKTLLANDINALTFLGTDMSILASRISYFLDLKGPSLAIDTACSSSLVAIHYACESIRRGESEVALGGGVFVINSPEFMIMASKTEMLSPDGTCKTFDNDANGIVVGEGVGVLLLKRLDAAIQDRDHIYGVIKGSAINQDGRTQSITAPSSLSQKALLVEAYQKAMIHPETISYMEAHGTGTKLGDPIEFKALTEAFQMFTDKTQFCAIGSHKPNFGHTIMAAGMAGVLKILMAMKYRKIPPTIHFTKVNEHVDFDSSPFFLNTELLEWKRKEGTPLRAGISSFGFSGTNCHLIMEEAPMHESSPHMDSKPYYPFVFSAKTKTALHQKLLDLSTWLEKEAENYRFEDIAYTLLIGRSSFLFRCAFIAKDAADLKEKLVEIVQNGTTTYYFSNDTNQSPKREPVLKELKEYGESLLEELGEFSDISSDSYKEKLSVLLYLYIQGYSLNWNHLFMNENNHKIPLPTYPFNRRSFWYPEQPQAVNATPTFEQAIQLPKSQTELQPISSHPPSIQKEEQSVVDTLIISLANTLGIPANVLDIDTKFVDMGLDSITGVEWVRELNDKFGLSVKTTKIYDYPTIRQFVKLFEKESKTQKTGLLQVSYPSSAIRTDAEAAYVEKPKGIALKPMNDGRIDALDISKPSEMNVAINRQESIPANRLEETVIHSLANMLGIASDAFDQDTMFVDMGLDSVTGVEWIQEINSQFGLSIKTTKIYDYPTIRAFLGFLEKELKEQKRNTPEIPSQKSSSNSLQSLIQQVHQGKLGADQALQFFSLAERS